MQVRAMLVEPFNIGNQFIVVTVDKVQAKEHRMQKQQDQWLKA